MDKFLDVVDNDLISDLEMIVLYKNKEYNLIDTDDRKFILKLDWEEWHKVSIVDSELLQFDDNTSISEVIDVFDLLQLLHESQQILFVALYKQWVGSPFELVSLLVKSGYDCH